MRDRGPAPAPGDRAGPRQERGLNRPTFVGSFPAADFRTPAKLPEIAFLGRSNVGKSTLINAVCEAKGLARVSKTPGKTRACNVYDVDSRWYLVDLPGYGFASASHSEREAFAQLLREYVETRERLAGVVWLLDIRRDPSPEDLEMGDRFAERSVPLLAAITKSDKLTRTHQQPRLREITRIAGVPEDQAILTSSITGAGIEDLRRSIEALVGRAKAGTARD